MKELYLSISANDDVDELMANEETDGIEITQASNSSFEFSEAEAIELYHFLRQCLLLDCAVSIEVADEDGNLLSAKGDTL